MGTNDRSSWKEKRRKERDRQLVMLAVPVVLLILLIIIVVADRPEKEESVAVTTAAATPSDAIETMAGMTGSSELHPGETDEAKEPTDCEEDEESETAEPEPDYLEKDTVPEINELMKAYYDARANCDAETLSRLYGRLETDVVELERTRKQLLLYARYISSVDQITCYTVQFENQNVWFVIMTANIHFRSTDTVVPTGQQFFVMKDDGGSFLLVRTEAVTEEQKAFGEEIRRLDEARLLALDINTKMKDAIDSDPELTNIYGTLHSGSPLWETGEPETEPEVEILTY